LPFGWVDIQTLQRLHTRGHIVGLEGFLGYSQTIIFFICNFDLTVTLPTKAFQISMSPLSCWPVSSPGS